jgi:hypothetical protein
MCCSFSVIQGARVETSTDASNFTPLVTAYGPFMETVALQEVLNKNWALSFVSAQMFKLIKA